MPPTDERLFSKESVANLASLPPERKCSLINAFWPHFQLEVSDYIEHYYADLFNSIGKTLESLYQFRTDFAIQELESLLETVRKIRTHQALTKDKLVDEIKKDHLNVNGDDVVRSVELAARFWLGINICSRALSVGPNYPRHSRIEWQHTQSLEQLGTALFSQKKSWIPFNEFSLDESFTAVSLKNTCRLHIWWTDNLVDHLRLRGSRGQRNLSVYRHKICLVNHSKDPKAVAIEASVLQEAIRTLDLLFPFGDSKTADFLQSEGVHFYSVAPVNPQPFDLGEFTHWRDNLVQLLRLLNGPPESASQTLFDTRNISQFATLWIAIFGVFGLTILFGILATVYSVKQYRVALDAYGLALASAYHEFPDLPKYCRDGQ